MLSVGLFVEAALGRG